MKAKVDTKIGEEKPVNINFPGWSIPFLVLSIPLMVIAIFATFFFIFGFVIIAIPIGLLVAGICVGIVKIMDWWFV